MKIAMGDITRDYTEFILTGHDKYDYCNVEFENGSFSRIVCFVYDNSKEVLRENDPLYKELKSLAVSE